VSGKKSSSSSHKAKRSDIEFDADVEDQEDSLLNKYTNDYEKRLDPFSKFSFREKQKRYANLKLHDKFTLNFGRFILSNKTARLIFCAYFLLIHLLIFLNLYHVAHTGATNRDMSAECAHAYKHHMAEVHGNKGFEINH
jgi:homeobox protein cut-like